jgi:polar amino acid transport system substrate-binding protein
MPLIFLFLLICYGSAIAACSRPIVMPASPLGKMIVVKAGGTEVSGIYVDLLRERGKKAGCEFVFPVMPRARAEMMVATGNADMLIGAIKVPERDVSGYFVPIFGTEAMLISHRDEAPPKTVQQLLDKPDIRVNVVRGFNFGPTYLAMLARLNKLGKLEYVADVQTILRKMQAGRVDYTFMPSTTFAGAIEELGLRESFGQQIHYSRLSDIPAGVNGAYLSKRMTPGDVAQVEAVLAQIRRDGEILTRLRRLFTSDEMSSQFALPAQKDGR